MDAEQTERVARPPVKTEVFSQTGEEQFQVEAWALAWHPVNGSRVRLKIHGAWSGWKPVSSTDLVAFAAIMEQEPVTYEDGWIRSGPDSVPD